MGAVPPRDRQGAANAALYGLDESGGEDYGYGGSKRGPCTRRAVDVFSERQTNLVRIAVNEDIQEG